MKFEVSFINEVAQAEFLNLPNGLKARGVYMLDMLAMGLRGEPHTKALESGLFELRIKSKEGIARSLFCYQIGARIIILRTFVKKSDKIPPTELEIASARLKELKC